MKTNDTKAHHKQDPFAGGYSCAQYVLLSRAEACGVRREDAFRIAGGFGGGMAFGEVCGAVSGAIMLIGLTYASATADPEENYSKNLTYELVGRFMEQFRLRAGALCCRDLIGFDLSKIDNYQHIRNTDRNLYVRCPGFVQTALELLEDIFNSVEK